MKDHFLIRFAPFVAVSPALPAAEWLDYAEQCHELARTLGSGEYWVCEQNDSGRYKFWV